jgi:protein involved in sex pheromone biosynthesis
MRAKLCAALALTLFLGGCTSASVENVSDSAQIYQAATPFIVSDTRAKHVGLISDIDIRVALEQGLMELSEEYFSPDRYTYRTHMFLDYDELDATDGSRGLLGTLRDDNPNGLNPSADEEFDTGNGIATGPVLLVDLYEIDYYEQDALKGIAIGLAVTDTATVNGESVEITPEKMQQYLQVTGTKITSYMRERFNDITSSVPILIGAYQLNTDSSDTSKGGYIYLEYNNGSSSTYETISEDYVTMPSSAFSSKDPEAAEQFSTFKADCSSIITDNTYVTGTAHYQNDALVSMTLDVTAYGKTAGEILAIIEGVQNYLSVFTVQECSIKVIVKNNNETVALMSREDADAPVNLITVY